MRIRCVFLLPLLLPACSNSGNEVPRPDADIFDAAAPVPLDQLAAELKSALCARIYACCSPEQRKNNARIGQDVASCQQALNEKATYLLADVHLSVEGGRAAYHPAALASCLSRIQTTSCEELRMPASNADITRTCDGILEPKVAPGGSCSAAWDCIGGWCQGDEDGTGNHCTVLRSDGEECDEGLECKSGLCNDARVCAPLPSGRGSICALGTEIVGQHGAAP